MVRIPHYVVIEGLSLFSMLFKRKTRKKLQLAGEVMSSLLVLRDEFTDLKTRVYTASQEGKTLELTVSEVGGLHTIFALLDGGLRSIRSIEGTVAND